MRAFSLLCGLSSWTRVHFGRAHGICSLSLTSSAPPVGCSAALGFHLAGRSICPLFCRTPTFLLPCRMSLTTQLTHHSPLPSPLSALSLLSHNHMRVRKGLCDLLPISWKSLHEGETMWGPCLYLLGQKTVSFCKCFWSKDMKEGSYDLKVFRAMQAPLS